jgi:hypothetical protein
LDVYRRVLIQRLQPLLRKHLISRVQAMIILGESGSPDAIDIYKREINDANQTLWVKIWALEGITNIQQKGVGRLTADAESRAAKVVSDFLDKNDDLPWPVVQRALQAIGALRQGFLPTAPRKADMANTAMRFLADAEAKPEIRAEAARTLGLLQITAAVPKYNFALVAHDAGLLAAELGTAIGSCYLDKPPRVDNPTKARYLSALLLGPVYEAFEGSPEAKDSGLLHAMAGPSAGYIQHVYDLVKPVAQTSVQLLGAPTKEYMQRKKELAVRVAALRSYLEKHPPPNRQLVQDGKEFPAAGAAGVWRGGSDEPLVGLPRGR